MISTYYLISVQFSSFKLLSHVRIFATPWTAGRQASLSITNSWNLPKLMSTELVMPSNHLILCRSLLLPSIFPRLRVFSMSQLFASGGQSIGVSASASVLPMNIQDWFPLGWTGWISLQSKGLSQTQRDGVGTEVGGEIRMGNTCKSMADSCQCMAKTTTIL